MSDDAITPFLIDIREHDLADLAVRLDRTRWPDESPGAVWSYGVARSRVRELATYWRHQFDWRGAEARLNQFPQFTTVIDGQRIHFLHVRSPEPDAFPLVLTHGWPGSFAEFGEFGEAIRRCPPRSPSSPVTQPCEYSPNASTP